MNVDLLRKIQETLKVKPQQFEMNQWWVDLSRYDTPILRGADDVPMHSCNTAGCLAGWAVMLVYPDAKICGMYQSAGTVILPSSDNDDNPPTEAIETEAQNLLGLTDSQARTLFIPQEWLPAYRGPIKELTYLHTHLQEEYVGKKINNASKEEKQAILDQMAAIRIQEAALTVEYIDHYIEHYAQQDNQTKAN